MTTTNELPTIGKSSDIMR